MESILVESCCSSARGELQNRPGQVFLLKFRPAHWRREKFCTAGLPEKEIAETLLAGGSDEQVQRRHAGCEEAAFELCGTDLGGVDFAVRGARGQILCDAQQFIVRAVIQGQAQVESLAFARQFLRALELGL